MASSRLSCRLPSSQRPPRRGGEAPAGPFQAASAAPAPAPHAAAAPGPSNYLLAKQNLTCQAKFCLGTSSPVIYWKIMQLNHHPHRHHVHPSLTSAVFGQTVSNFLPASAIGWQRPMIIHPATTQAHADAHAFPITSQKDHGASPCSCKLDVESNHKQKGVNQRDCVPSSNFTRSQPHWLRASTVPNRLHEL